MTTEIKTIDRADEASERKAFAWATANQGFVGSWDDWRAMSDFERQSYEVGAAGISGS